MKTTIDIAAPVLNKAKRVAAERGITLKTLVEEALRSALEAPPGRKKKAFRVKTFGGQGLQPGVEWGDWETWRGIAYEGRGG